VFYGIYNELDRRAEADVFTLVSTPPLLSLIFMVVKMKTDGDKVSSSFDHFG
jgi:hypothetical protein